MKKIKLFYERADIDVEDMQRRISEAFAFLFEATAKRLIKEKGERGNKQVAVGNRLLYTGKVL